MEENLWEMYKIITVVNKYSSDTYCFSVMLEITSVHKKSRSLQYVQYVCMCVYVCMHINSIKEEYSISHE